MKHVDLDFPLPGTAIELLFALVETAEQYQIKTIAYREVQTREQLVHSLNSQPSSPAKDPLSYLEKWGLIEKVYKYRVRLYPVAFERARYERKNWLGKWWIKTTHRLQSFAKGVLSVSIYAHPSK